MKILYLDYDNVLHGEVRRYREPPILRLETPGQLLFQNAPILEALLEPYADVKIVLSTSWVRVFGFDRARAYLPPALSQKVIGATFHRRHMRKEEFSQLARYAQIFADVGRRRPSAWLAIDDEVDGWPAHAISHLVPMPPVLGLGCPTATSALKLRLETAFKQ